MKFTLFRHVLTPENLAHFKAHKYDCRGKGIIEKHVDALARDVICPRIPTWIAPNLITLTGFTIHFLAAMLIICNDHISFAYEEPAWKALLYIVSLILYGIFDSLDGAQARRTGTSSPLGELFDHGFDAITMSLILSALCALLRYSYFVVRVVTVLLLGNLVFIMAHWKAFTFGYLQFNSIDATEGQYMVSLVYLLYTLLGFDFFWYELPTSTWMEQMLRRRLEVADVFYFAAVIGAIAILVKGLYDIVTHKGRTTFAGLPTYTVLVQIIVNTVLAIVAALLMHFLMFDFMLQFIIIALAMPFIKITWQLLLCYMSHSAVPMFDTGSIPTALLVAWLAFIRRDYMMTAEWVPPFMFNAIALYSIIDFAYFACSNIYVISRTLGVSVLTIPSGYSAVPNVV